MTGDKTAIQRLIKTARGQLDGILRMIEEDRYCVDISNQLMATQAILRKANQEIILAHLNCCVRKAFASGSEDEQKEKLEEIKRILDKMAK
ncbi:MAG: metal-sensing transcriptional repressor [Oscillospiraceae bacterium]|nr:metal-sensing transcriptional repressor [Oscillospiraceae bacterium]